jgi:large conductance mechanosensitive channel
MKKFFKEFKEFALKGNVMDLAIGMIIGAAFTAIVTSLVNDVIMPLLSLITGGYLDFSNIVLHINNVDVNFGALLTAIVTFICIALVLFLLIKGINKMQNLRKKEEEEAEPTTKECPFCKSEIPLMASRCPHCTSELPEEK